MRWIFAILVLLTLTVACKKNKFTTKPQLKVTDVNLTDVQINDVLKIKIQLTDKEADFLPYFGYRKVTTSCTASNFSDTTKLRIPGDFIAKKISEGEILLEMDRSVRGDNQCRGTGSTFKPDTVVFKFWTKDAAGNFSDTAVTKQIILHQQ